MDLATVNSLAWLYRWSLDGSSSEAQKVLDKDK